MDQNLVLIPALVATITLQTLFELTLIKSVAAVAAIYVTARLFYREIGWLVIPLGPNPFAHDCRQSRRPYQLDQRERDNILKQSFKALFCNIFRFILLHFAGMEIVTFARVGTCYGTSYYFAKRVFLRSLLFCAVSTELI